MYSAICIKKGRTRSSDNPIIVLMIILFLICIIHQVKSQTILRDYVFYTVGKSSLSNSNKNRISGFIEKGSEMKQFIIILTSWQDKQEEQKFKMPLAKERLKNIYRYLIANNFGTQVIEMKIRSIDTANRSCNSKKYRGRIDLLLVEKFPETDKPLVQSSLADVENDTIIKCQKGTLIKIQGGSFESSKISDYRFEIKELLTVDEIVSNNLSTVTIDNKLINSAGIICIRAVPKYPGRTQPEKFLKPVIMLIPMSMDSNDVKYLSVFRKKKGRKEGLMWQESHDKVRHVKYDGNNYLMYSTDKLGYVMVGEETKCSNCCRIKIPAFEYQKFHFLYPKQNAVIIYQEKKK